MDRGMKAAELATAADVARSYVFGGSLRWVGEHRVCALKRQGDEETARVSLYHTHASAAGEGVVAYVSIRGADDRWRPIVAPSWSRRPSSPRRRQGCGFPWTTPDT